MAVIAYLLSFLALIFNVSLFLNLGAPSGFYFVFFQLGAAALSPFLVLAGLLGATLGWLSDAPVAVAAGLLGAGISLAYIILVTRSQPGFDQAFGKDWRTRIPRSVAARLLRRRWAPGLPRTSEPALQRDLAFWMIPGSDRQLLCDLWEPPAGVERSGLALIYFHGSAWWIFDKDFGTRPFFRRLAAQGHVVMDVAYRLCPEVDIYGMVGDVKRALAWMKANADRYGIDPARVVLGGASAGGHLSMLAAYAPYHPLLTPPEVLGSDLTVRAVVSYYGPADLKACYRHTRQDRLVHLPKVEVGPATAAMMKKSMKDAGRLDTLLGGHPDEVPEVYELASPLTHVHPGCPPTLLVQGAADLITPVAATRELYRKLVECGVPAVNIIFPLTNHAFDLPLPQVSPPSQAATYYLERFLTLMAISAPASGPPSPIPEGLQIVNNL
jgi:acetyl esterase/lipase